MRNFALKAYAKYQDRRMRRLHADEDGVTIVEYGLAAAVISALLALAAYFVFNGIITTAGDEVANVLPTGLSAP
ncbi:MAG: Flp family type IVb pilin [Dehalococcoidia bacterium]